MREKLYEYDLNLESGSLEYANADWLNRYIIYRTIWQNGRLKKTELPLVNRYSDETSRNGAYKGLCDPDGSGYSYYPITHDIYKSLWDWEKGADTFGKIQGGAFSCEFGGDTMNSVQTALGRIIDNLSRKNGWDELRGNTKIWLSSDVFTINLYLNKADEMRETLEDIAGLKEYICYYTTIGNLCLVPSMFNGERGKNRQLCDYWDRSLEYLHSNGWQETFSCHEFYRYVNYFFLWEWVDSSGMVERLSDDLNNIEDYSRFLQKSVRKIKRRGIFMNALLEIADKYPHIYADIKQQIMFQGNALCSGYSEVLDMVESRVNGITKRYKALLEQT